MSEVAEQSGLSLPYVSNLERGRGNPTLDALRALAKALDVPLPSDQAIPNVLAEISRRTIPKRRHRTSPWALKRIRHNSCRVKKRGETSSTRHPGPATIRIHAIQPRAA